MTSNEMWEKCEADAAKAVFRLCDMNSNVVAEGSYKEIVAALWQWYDDDFGEGGYHPKIASFAAELLCDIRENGGRAYNGPEEVVGPEYYFEEVA